MKIFGISPISTAKTNFKGYLEPRYDCKYKGSEAFDIFEKRVQKETNRYLNIDVRDATDDDKGVFGTDGNLILNYDCDDLDHDRYFMRCNSFEYDESKNPEEIANALWENLEETVSTDPRNRGKWVISINDKLS